MKIHLLSDIHLEFADFTPSTVVADLVILAGDISTGHRGLKWALDNFGNTPVIYIPGNHEFYYTSVEQWLADAEAMLTGQSRVSLGLAKRHFFNEPGKPRVRVLATTLWTDFALYGKDCREHSGFLAEQGLSDFEVIRFKDRPLTWKDTFEFHKAELAWLRNEVAAGMAAGDRIVVATHHGSTTACNNPRFPNSPIAPAFSSKLDDWVMDSTINAWFFGHTHHNLDMDVGNTRFVANQRGYLRQGSTKPEAAGFDPKLVITV